MKLFYTSHCQLILIQYTTIRDQLQIITDISTHTGLPMRPLQSNSASTSNTFTKLSNQRAVGPGEGSSILAVELSNTGFSDISGVTGYLKLPPGFRADNSGSSSLKNGQQEINSFTSVASSSDVIKSGQTYTLYFKVKVLGTAALRK